MNPFHTTTASDNTSSPSGDPIRGIDIGTGASCIYALLGARLNGWKFIATEIDSASYASALENVARNALESQILVQKVETDRLLLEPLAHEKKDTTKFHFSMCNPPFFEDMSQADTNPETCCMGSSSEMVCPGGEVAFITSMIEDSLVLQTRVVWYTSMIGRKSTIRKILKVLRDKHVPHTRTAEFFQGRTKRWGIAWTFVTDLVDSDAAQVSESFLSVSVVDFVMMATVDRLTLFLYIEQGTGQAERSASATRARVHSVSCKRQQQPRCVLTPASNGIVTFVNEALTG